jgi:hypothetical protein
VRQVGYKGPRTVWVVLGGRTGYREFDDVKVARRHVDRHGGTLHHKRYGWVPPRPPEDRDVDAFCAGGGRTGKHPACLFGGQHGEHWFKESDPVRGCCLTPVSERCKCSRPAGLPGWMPWPAEDDPSPETTALIFRLDRELARAEASRAWFAETVKCAVCGRNPFVGLHPKDRPASEHS